MIVGHNTYYDGASQNLEIPTEAGRATVGAMEPGRYQFTARLDEHVHVLDGAYRIRSVAGQWYQLAPGEVVIVHAGTTFGVELPRHAAQLCCYFEPGRGSVETGAHRIGST